MKRKSKIIVFLTILIAFITFFTIKNFTQTKYGKLNTYTALNLMIDRFLNPKLSKEQSIEKIRQNLNRDSSKLSKPPIPFSNIKNTFVQTPNAITVVRYV